MSISALDETRDWLICTACGTQFPTADRRSLTTCFICDDPRQFTPPGGQAFTTLGDISAAHHRNEFQTSDDGGGGGGAASITWIATAPKLGIGQRCALVRTPAGNVLWDCITLLDEATVRRIRDEFGGVAAIVISHPHYYSTHLLWAAVFGCPVYLAAEDDRWLAQRDPSRQVFLGPAETEREVVIGGKPSGATILKLGGHFPGSLVLLFDGHLFIADTLVTTPAGMGSWETDAAGTKRDEGHLGRPAGMNSFAFMWSIPNMIPLPPDDISKMWAVLERHDFSSTHGAFMGLDIADAKIKSRVLESMQIQIRGMGYPDHALLKKSL